MKRLMNGMKVRNMLTGKEGLVKDGMFVPKVFGMTLEEKAEPISCEDIYDCVSYDETPELKIGPDHQLLVNEVPVETGSLQIKHLGPVKGGFLAMATSRYEEDKYDLFRYAVAEERFEKIKGNMPWLYEVYKDDNIVVFAYTTKVLLPDEEEERDRSYFLLYDQITEGLYEVAMPLEIREFLWEKGMEITYDGFILAIQYMENVILHTLGKNHKAVFSGQMVSLTASLNYHLLKTERELLYMTPPYGEWEKIPVRKEEIGKLEDYTHLIRLKKERNVYTWTLSNEAGTDCIHIRSEKTRDRGYIVSIF